ncbi:MAG: formate dehydrogenase subunit alpha [Alphaproteobacteria bacterium GM7ARS4]|nr:formate dehydrogenase subunit alpha [Alphaproteobacteria bacterium GM7ARS4]
MSLPKKKTLSLTLDGRKVSAREGETIWEVAKREHILIPHLCHADKAGYRPDGNCRACMVDIEGERVLAASCIRKVSQDMVVSTESQRAVHSRRMVMELLLADQPERVRAHDDDSHFWRMAEHMDMLSSRFPRHGRHHVADNSHRAMAVHLDACIHCNLCTQACREVQVNDVIGMAGRGAHSKIVFDFDDPMGDSSCVACGECVQACPTGALMESSLLDESGVIAHKPDKEVDSLCPYCGVGCQLTFRVKDERIVAVDGRVGPANQGRLCVKGRFGFDYVHHPHRLTKPLIRKDGVSKNPDEKIDPSRVDAYFREVTWEEALARAGGGFVSIRERDSASALAGFGCAKGSNEEAYLFQKLVRTGFGNNNVDHCTRLCHASSVAALMEGIGSGAVTAPVSEVKNADVAIIIGARPAQNHPVAATFIKNAAVRGTQLIVLDPRRNELERYARHHVQFRPGTDVALLNAMLHVIIEEGLVDRQYIEKHTSGYKELCSHVASFTPEEMSGLCGVDADTIREIARCYGKAERAMIFWGMGISQHVHGTDNARCLIALALITGNVGRHGTGLHPLRGQNNVQGASDAGLIPMVFPDYQKVEDDSRRLFFEKLWGTSLDPHAGLTVVEIMQHIDKGHIKGLYIMGENPAMSDPNAAHARMALAKLEHMVVQDLFLTETAFLADVILPASAFPEKSGTFTNTDRLVQLARPALSPPGDAKQDWWIIQEMAKRLGCDWRYHDVGDIYEEMRSSMESLKGISWERLQKEGSVTYPCSHVDEEGEHVLFGDGFPTSDKKGHIVAADIIPPDEQPDEEYPMVLTTGRLLEHWHTGSMTRRTNVLNTIEPHPYIHLSPADMDEKGLVGGDRVRIETRRGALDAQVRPDRQIPQGIVFMPFCFEEAPVNFLTNDALDPDGKIPEVKYCAVKLEKIHAT